MRRLWAVLATVALFGAGCAGDDDDGAATATEGREQGAAGERVTVEVDGEAPDFAMAARAYFPDTATLHPGDTVAFHANDTGEPHTVTFGTVGDAAVEGFELPPLLDDRWRRANPLAANPCFVAHVPPSGEACPRVGETPVFDGTHAVYSSGYLPGGESFEVRLADDLAPGAYDYFCLLHGGAMTGRITVVPAGQEAQTAEEVQQAGEKKLDELVAELRPKAKLVARAPAAEPVAGAPPSRRADEDEDEPARVVEFGPRRVSVPVGATVTWTVYGPHTVSFNAPEDARGVMVEAPDGTWHVNGKAIAPAASPGVPPRRRPAVGAEAVLVDGGRFDGSGFKSSGLILAFGAPVRYEVTFTKPGTYKVQCLVHPEMDGRVKVT